MTVFIFLGSAARRHGTGHSYRLRACWSSGVALMWHLDLFDAQILAQNFINGADSFPLLAVPFFMLAGEIMNVGGLSQPHRRISHSPSSATSKAAWDMSSSSRPCLLSALVGLGCGGCCCPDGAAAADDDQGRAQDRERAGGLIAAGRCHRSHHPAERSALSSSASSANVSISKLFIAGIFPGIMIGLRRCALTWMVAGAARRQLVLPPNPIAVGETLLAPRHASRCGR